MLYNDYFKNIWKKTFNTAEDIECRITILRMKNMDVIDLISEQEAE